MKKWNFDIIAYIAGTVVSFAALGAGVYTMTKYGVEVISILFMIAAGISATIGVYCVVAEANKLHNKA